MDLSQKEPLTAEMNDEGIKCCADCKITKTPLWRGGPSGPKSLCNACGIRHRKKKSAPMVGVMKGKDKMREKTSVTATDSSTTSGRGGDSIGRSGKNSSKGKCDKNGKLSADLRVRLMALGKEVVVLQRKQRSPMKRQRSSKKLGK